MFFSKRYKKTIKYLVTILSSSFIILLNGSFYGILSYASEIQDNPINLHLNWEKKFGNQGFETIHDLLPISDHQFIAIGSSDSPGNAWESVWLLKGNQFGEIIVEKQIGNQYYNAGRAMIAAPKNQILVGGEKNWLYCPSCHELGEAWVAMIDEELNVLWEKTFNLEGNCSILSMNSSTEEGFSLGGFEQMNRSTASDAWFALSDWEGNLLWNNKYDRLYQDKITDALDLGKEGFLFSGHSQSKDLTKSIAWVLKTGRQGEIEWEKDFIGQGINVLNQTIQFEENSFVSVGYTTSKGAGWQDGWVIHWDKNGEIIWEKTFGEENRDILTSLIKKDSFLFVAGHTFVTEKSTDYGWIIQLDKHGEVIWEKTFGEENRAGNLQGIKQRDQSAYYLFGRSRISQKETTNEDGWIIQFSLF